MVVHSKKASLLPSVWPDREYTWALIWKKSLLICFESFQRIPYSLTGKVDRGYGEHFANGQHLLHM